MGKVADGSAGQIIRWKFTTREAGVPATLSGSPVVSIYKDASTTESVAGVTLTVDFDSRTGLNHISVDTSADGTFYSNGSHFEGVITTGTSGGTSVVSECIGSFDLAAAVTAPTAAQVATAVWDEVNTGATHNITNSTGKQLRAINPNTEAIYPLTGTVNLTAATSTTATLDLLASAVSQAYQYDVINLLSGTGAGQSRVITNYTTGRVATVSPAFTTTPDATTTFDITPTASVQVVSYVAGQDPATLVWAAATRTLTSLVAPPTDWLTAAAVSAGAVTKIQAGLSTYAGGDTSGTTTLLARLTSTRAGLLDNLDATISSRLAASSYTAPPTAAAVATAVWTTTTAGDFATTSSPGKILVTQLGGTFTTTSSSVFTTAALANGPTGGSGSDPWSTPLPGAYASGTAGYMLGHSGVVVVPTVAEVATAVWEDLLGGGDFGTSGSIGKLLRDDINVQLSTLSTYAGGDTPGTTTLLSRLTSTRAANLDFLDVAVSSRSTYAGADTAGTTTLLSRLTSTRAGLLDNLANLDVAVSTLSTYAGGDTPGITTLLARIGSSITISAGKLYLAPGGLDSITNTEVSEAPANFRETQTWTYQRFAGNVARTTSGTDGTIVVKTGAGATATTQTTSDDGAGNQAQGAIS